MAAVEIPCPDWCVADHSEQEYHERRTLGQPYAEVGALLMEWPGHSSVKWIDLYLGDEHLVSPQQARDVAAALVKAADILDATPGVF